MMNYKNIIAAMFAVSASFVATASEASDSIPWLEHDVAFTGEYGRGWQDVLDEETFALGLIDLTATITDEQSILPEGGEIFFYGMATFGEQPSELIGDLQVSSNIEAPPSIRLYELWYKQNFTDNFWVLAGLHDYNADFYALEPAGYLLNASFGIGIDTSQVGPSIYTLTALGAVVGASTEKGLYLKLAGYDGVPGNPESDERRTHIILDSDDGIFYAAEAGYEMGVNKLGIGGWFLDKDFTDLTGHDKSDNFGVYVIGSVEIGLDLAVATLADAFLQIGWADPDNNLIENYYGAGVSFSLPITPIEDLVALGVARAEISDTAARGDDALSSHETVVELQYRLPVCDYLTLVPDVQWVVNPGADRSRARAVVGILRVEMAL